MKNATSLIRRGRCLFCQNGLLLPSIPSLLRLSSDIETKPGPTVYDVVGTNKTVRADVSQGDQVRFAKMLESDVLQCP